MWKLIKGNCNYFGNLYQCSNCDYVVSETGKRDFCPKCENDNRTSTKFKKEN